MRCSLQGTNEKDFEGKNPHQVAYIHLFKEATSSTLVEDKGPSNSSVRNMFEDQGLKASCLDKIASKT